MKSDDYRNNKQICAMLLIKPSKHKQKKIEIKFDHCCEILLIISFVKMALNSIILNHNHIHNHNHNHNHNHKISYIYIAQIP